MARNIRAAANPAGIPRRTRPLVLAAFAGMLLFCGPAPISAQTIEAAPLAGYRFGGDLFELAINRPVDLDGAPVVGGIVNIEITDESGLSFEALFTRQKAQGSLPGSAYGPPAHFSVVVDHWLAGGRQELGNGRVRPFLTGLVGLTRYGTEGDNEIRFAVGTGGGVKVPLQRRLGLRLDGRVFTTFVDADARVAACGPGLCFVNVNVNLAWQMEFSAELVVLF